MDPASTLLKLAAVLVLVGINAYFVAAEFALVAVRRTRIEQLVRAGSPRARHVARALERPDDFISAAQLGITAASIGIGYIAEATIHALLVPYIERLPLGLLAAVPGGSSPTVAAHIIATVLTLMLVTYLHVVLGEQVPKLVSIQRAEPVILWTAWPTLAFGALFKPFIRLMSGSANLVIRSFGLEPSSGDTLAHTPEEIRMLVEQSHQEGMVEADEEQMISGVLEFRSMTAREVMTPRPDIVAVPADATLEQVVEVITREGHSRLPVYEGNLDEIVGVVLAKDLFPYLAGTAEKPFDLRAVMREPWFVPDTKRIDDLLAELRAKSLHMAIVLDEFGGTEGLVTLEDLLEEIVGDIYDEHDLPEAEFVETEDGHVLVDGGASIAEVNERFGLELPDDDFSTIGGYIFGELGRVPVKGDVVTLPTGGEFRVEETEERRVTRVRYVTPRPSVVESATS